MPAVIFIDKNKFEFYPSGTSTVLTFPFQETIIKDLEILNREELTGQIRTFIVAHKLKPVNTAIILSNAVIFEKDLSSEMEQEQQDQLIESFIENVPFNNKIYKVFSLQKGVKVAVTNKDLFETIQEPFEASGFMIEIVAPDFLVEKNIVNLSPTLAKSIIKRFEFLKQNGFVFHEEAPPVEFEPEEQKKNDNKRQYVLLGVFIFLMLILAALLVRMLSLSKSPKQQNIIVATVAPVAQNITSSPTLFPTTIPTTGLIQIGVLKVQILNGSGTIGQAEIIKSNLNKFGLQNVKTGNANNITLSKTLIIFTQNVPADVREKVIEAVKKTVPDVSVQETSASQFDITITTSKQG